MTTNKNLRPYVCSIDWLQLHLHRSPMFHPSKAFMKLTLFNSEHEFTFRELQYGSKTYQSIFKVLYDGEEWGELSMRPHSKQINELSCTLKLANKVCYAPNFMESIADFICVFDFKYIGITRLDLAYDFNELYGGLTAEHFMRKYEKGEIIKFGAGTGYRQFKQSYELGYNMADKKMTLQADVREDFFLDNLGRKTKAYEEEEERQKIYKDPSCLIELPEERNPLVQGRPLDTKLSPILYTSTTWGSRSSGHQVQLYNKTLEMQQVAYKHHIAQRWVDYGLSLKKDVWRIEIRITKGAKLLERASDGKHRLLDPRDILCEEQIEQIFHDYARKYFRFYSLDLEDKRSAKNKKMRPLEAALAHKDRLRDYRIFSIAKRNADGVPTEPIEQKFVPRTPIPKKDYTRSVKIALNVLEGAIVSSAKYNNPDIVHHQETYRMLTETYNVHKRHISDIKNFDAMCSMEKGEYEICQFYRENWPEVEDKWFSTFAEAQSFMKWESIRAGVAFQEREFLRNHGYNVLPLYTEQAISALLDTGEVPEELLYIEHEPPAWSVDMAIEYREHEDKELSI